MTDKRDNKSLARSLGEFVGHVWKGVTSDPPAGKQKKTLRHETEEETRDTPEGRVTLRRTTIEEMELDPSKREQPDQRSGGSPSG